MYAVYFVSNTPETHQNKAQFRVFSKVASDHFRESPFLTTSARQRQEFRQMLDKVHQGAILTYGPNHANLIKHELKAADPSGLYEIKVVDLAAAEG